MLPQRAPRLYLWLFRDPRTQPLGLAGEELVARTLRRRGATIEGRRLRTPWGELDILARDTRGLICIEVKTARPTPLPRIRGQPAVSRPARDRPGARVDAQGWKRLQRIADGIGARRRTAARCEVWEVVAGPGRGTLEIRLVTPS